jgi:hypothetical protein
MLVIKSRIQDPKGLDWISSSVRYLHIHTVISMVFRDGLVPVVLCLNPRFDTPTHTHHTRCRCGATDNRYSVTHCDPRCDPCLTLSASQPHVCLSYPHVAKNCGTAFEGACSPCSCRNVWCGLTTVKVNVWWQRHASWRCACVANLEEIGHLKGFPSWENLSNGGVARV